MLAQERADRRASSGFPGAPGGGDHLGLSAVLRAEHDHRLADPDERAQRDARRR